MDGFIDSEGTSVDIKSEIGNTDLLVKDIGQGEQEIKLKIVEDNDGFEDTSVTGNFENCTEKQIENKLEHKTEHKSDENSKLVKMGETPSKDVPNEETGKSVGIALDNDRDKAEKTCNNSTETEDNNCEANCNGRTDHLLEQQTEGTETKDIDGRGNTEGGATDQMKIDTNSNESNDIVTNSEETKSSSCDLTSLLDEEQSEGNLYKCFVKGAVGEDNNDEMISDPLKQAEVDSFLTSVCEEMIQNLREAEKELNDTSDVAKEVVDDKDTVCHVASVQTDVADRCLELNEDGAETGEANSVRLASEEIVETNNKLSEKDVKLKKLEADNMVLQGELQDARAMLHLSQVHARDQQVKHNQLIITLKLQLYKNQAMLKQQRTKSDKQVSEVMAHLMMLEGQLKREQCRVKHEMKLKNTLIENQKFEIVKLREQNEQLLNAIKEICAKGGMNGYMREKKKAGSSFEPLDNGKMAKDKKVHNGKLNTVKDKLSWKNRSSLELNNFDLEKYLIKSGRMYSSHEDLQHAGRSRTECSVSNLVEGNIHSPRRAANDLKEKFVNSPGYDTHGEFKKSPRNSQNFFYDDSSPKMDISASVSESSQLSEKSSTSGFQSLSDHDISNQDIAMAADHHGNNDFNDEDDQDDECYFSFSSTRINTVIDEEEVIGSYGQMTSMGSMPNISNKRNSKLHSNKDRPHSLSSVDLASIELQAETIRRLPFVNVESEMQTPPSSPSAVQNKADLSPFQTFKTMFKRKGTKTKGKKRSVSLSQTTSKEYTEAMKKHFQKYDMS